MENNTATDVFDLDVQEITSADSDETTSALSGTFGGRFCSCSSIRQG
ncbi:hypothetical protein OG352_00660 [Streptomyces sp. NBC_01485]|nr:hypothetical protein [Streptomyces sp. NBC_01485]